MTEKFDDFDITISEPSSNQIKIIIYHPEIDYIGVIDITELSKCPGFRKLYKESRKEVPIIHIQKGLLSCARDISFNSFSMDTEYRDVVIYLENYYIIGINVEQRTFTIDNTKDGYEKVIKY